MKKERIPVYDVAPVFWPKGYHGKLEYHEIDVPDYTDPGPMTLEEFLNLIEKTPLILIPKK